MLERSERILKIICVALAAIMLYELATAVFQHSPLQHMSIPALPTLAAASDGKVGGPGTNSIPSKAGGKLGTNSSPATVSGKPATNSIGSEASAHAGTNSISAPASMAKPGTNAPQLPDSTAKSTNSALVQASTTVETNSIAGPEPQKKGTNIIATTNLISGTNGALGTNLVLGTNTTSRPHSGKRAMNLNGPQGAGTQAAELPPVIQARIDKIIDSEILGQVIHPMPMGLIGIAGEYAFVRAPSGQTELVKEGAEMGGIKLLKIGINRVLVEEAGEKKELVIFEGYGGETLLPKPTEKPNETITKSK